MSDRLDQIQFEKFDKENMLQHIENFPKVCLEAWQKAKEFSIPSYYIKPNKFVILGMGGSGISGEILKDVLKGTDYLVEVVHDYTLPGWVDSETLVIASSYSGNTEETIDTFVAAHDKGAKLLLITTGGKLSALAEKFKVPVLNFDYESVPRAALAYQLVCLLSVFSKLGKIALSDEDFNRSIELLDNYNDKFKISLDTKHNLAKAVAFKVFNCTTVIYSGSPLRSAALRFKTQINENAKAFAFNEVFPELNHNATVGLIHPDQNYYILSLESNFDHPRVIKRQNITAEILHKNKINIERIKFVSCDSQITEKLVFILFGDYVSYYLAILYSEDPSPVKVIEYLKNELNK